MDNFQFLKRIWRKGGEEMESVELSDVGQALDEISWVWLSDVPPTLAEAIQREVEERQVEPETVRRYVMRHTQRYELALRCEQAARWLANGR